MKWPTTITVDKRIVKILSGSTYQNFPKALKEVIINSYDADATEVKIEVDTQNGVIIIEDNGNGMNEDDLSFYFRIAGRPRNKEEYTRSGRRIVGQFGVGFLAVFPFCMKYEIESKMKGSAEIVFAEIPASNYFTQENKLKNVNDILIQGGKKNDDTKISISYTAIKLSGFTELTSEFFKIDSNFPKNKSSVLSYCGLDKLKWELSEDLPIEYTENELNVLFGKSSNIKFNVKLNGEQLTRPVFGINILDKNLHEFEQIGNIKFKYFISTDYKSIKPVEARFIKIRNLDVGVGRRTDFETTMEGGGRSRLHHLTGEIHVLEGLNDLISVSRDQFNFSPDYEKMKKFFQKKLRSMSDKLEQIAEVEKSAKQVQDKNRIGNIDLLDSKTDKRIKIQNNEYTIKTGKWEIESDIFPACKIVNDTIIINKHYPLFSEKRYTDIFFKLHVILVLNYKNGNLKKEFYQKMLRDILEIYSDYKEL